MLEINNTTQYKINSRKLNLLTNDFLDAHSKKNWLVSLALIGSAKMRRLNSDYRGLNKTTDVLSFIGEAENKFLGEVIINIEEIKKVHQYLDIFTIAPKPEYLYYFIFVHGLLHLIGYDDATEKDRLLMIRKGKEFLKKNGIM